MRRLVPFLVFVATFSIVSSRATASPVCVAGPMASYLALGSDGCTDGPLTYSEFSYVGSTPATVAGVEPLESGLRFFNGDDGWIDVHIGFRVLADPGIVGEALRLDGGASPGSPGFDGGSQNQSVTATLIPGGELFTFANASLSPGCFDHASACYGILSAQFEDSLSTAPTAQQVIALDGSSSSSLRAPILAVEMVFNTPEPESIAMLLGAVLVLWLLGRRLSHPKRTW